MAKRTHVVFSNAVTVGHGGVLGTGNSRRITYGVYLDLDALEFLALKVSRNKTRKGHDGPVYIEIHSNEPIAR